MQNLKIDIDKLIKDLTQTKPKNIKKKVLRTPKISRPEIGLSEKFRLLTRDAKKETRSVYRSAINRFLQFIKDKENPDEWDLRRFFDYLDKQSMSRSYQRVAWHALKIYFQAKGIDWPLTKRDRPKLIKVVPPTLFKKQVESLISVTKMNGEPQEKVLLALSTTYGIRRSEFCNLTEKDINRDNHTLHVQTLKGGEERYHLIPAIIRPYVYSWNFNKKISPSGASLIFNSILAKAGIEKQGRMGLHAIRHGLVTELRNNGLSDRDVYWFLRWKQRELGMLEHYDNPNSQEIDQRIFSKHCFLPLWQ